METNENSNPVVDNMEDNMETKDNKIDSIGELQFKVNEDSSFVKMVKELSGNSIESAKPVKRKLDIENTDEVVVKTESNHSNDKKVKVNQC